jgi:hypothetical protein
MIKPRIRDARETDRSPLLASLISVILEYWQQNKQSTGDGYSIVTYRAK